MKPHSIMRCTADKTAIICAWCNEAEKKTGRTTGNDWADLHDYNASHGICPRHAVEVSQGTPINSNPLKRPQPLDLRDYSRLLKWLEQNPAQ